MAQPKSLLDLDEDILRRIVRLRVMSENKQNVVSFSNPTAVCWRVARRQQTPANIAHTCFLLRKLYLEEVRTLKIGEYALNESELLGTPIAVSKTTWSDVRYLRVILDMGRDTFKCPALYAKDNQHDTDQVGDNLKAFVLQFAHARDIELILRHDTVLRRYGDWKRPNEKKWLIFDFGRSIRVLPNLRRYEVKFAYMEGKDVLCAMNGFVHVRTSSKGWILQRDELGLRLDALHREAEVFGWSVTTDWRELNIWTSLEVRNRS